MPRRIAHEDQLRWVSSPLAEPGAAGLPKVTTPLNLLDEFYLHLHRPDEPASVHFEVRVEGRLDGERLAKAVSDAAARHPIARARLADTRWSDLRYRWEICDALERTPLEIAGCPDDAALDLARERFLSAAPSLDAPPPFAVLLAHHPEGDAVILNLHHAAADGIGAVRLMTSVLRAYAGMRDPLPSLDPLAVRHLAGHVVASSIADRLTRGPALLEHLAGLTTAPVRLTTESGSPRAGYGFELISLDEDELAALERRRRGGATINDVLLAAAVLSVRRWNIDHGAAAGRVAVMMPVNLRPSEWSSEVIANFAACVRVALPERAGRDLPAAVEAVAARTRRIKESRRAGAIVDMLAMAGLVPTGVKQRLQHLIPLTGNAVVDTTVLSNLGRLAPLPPPGNGAGRVRSIWFSPPSRMPLGASFGVATIDERLFITLRYRHPQFDAAAAAAFAGLYRETLLS